MTNVVNLAEYRARKRHHDCLRDAVAKLTELMAGEGLYIPDVMHEEAPSYLRQGIPLDAFTTPPRLDGPSAFTVPDHPSNNGTWLVSAWGAQPSLGFYMHADWPRNEYEWTEKDDDK